MINIIERCIAKYKIYAKKKYWKKCENINIDETVKLFPETTIGAFLGNITIGTKTCVRGNLEIQRKNGSIEIGSNCYIGDHTRIWAADSIKIGNNVLIAHNVNIFDNDTHPKDYMERREDAENIIWNGGVRNNFPSLDSAPIEIGDDAWIGCNSIILKGIKIGGGSIVAAGSVVIEDVPPYSMVAGNPAKLIKYLNSEKK